jgi:hypothetical protein
MDKTINQYKEHIKPVYFLYFAVLLSIICVVSLRDNNEHMIKLRNNVFTADKSDTNVTSSLQKLQAYVTHHMNTNLSAGTGSVYPPIQLKYTYQRLLDDESASAASSNLGLYTQAQTYCQGQIPTGFSGRYRVPCIEQFVESHDQQSLPTIPTSLYEFDFISPKWSPDLAGITMLLAALSLVVFVTSYSLSKAFKHLS